jgi:hypothetical protein
LLAFVVAIVVSIVATIDENECGSWCFGRKQDEQVSEAMM